MRLQRVQPLAGPGAPPVNRVVLDTRATGPYFQPGDRCALLPENIPQLVDRTLAALRATGDEPLPLTAA